MGAHQEHTRLWVVAQDADAGEDQPGVPNYLQRVEAVPPEVHGPAPLDQDRVVACLPHLMHLIDWGQKVAQQLHIELVPCAGWDSTSSSAHLTRNSIACLKSRTL